MMCEAPWQTSWMKSRNTEIYTWCLTYTQWHFSEKGSDQTVYADSNSVTRVSMNADRWKKRGGATEDVRGELMRERLLLDLITVKHWTLIGDIKTFYESSCSNLQHYNSVPVQNISAAALQFTFCASFRVQYGTTVQLWGNKLLTSFVLFNRGQICFKTLRYTVKPVFRCASVHAC